MDEAYRQEQEARDRTICQDIAQALWNAATSENRKFSSGDGFVYRSLERAFTGSVRIAYGLGATRAAQVRELLAEYGPHDSLTGTSGYGVASYVEYVKAHRGERF